MKGFNLNTYKLHSLGDYVETIRRYGTTDSYSTQLVSWKFSNHVGCFLIWFILAMPCSRERHLTKPQKPHLLKPARRITSASWLRLSGGKQEFVKFSKSWAPANQVAVLRLLCCQGKILEGIMRLENLKITLKTFFHFYKRTQKIQQFG